MKKPTHRYVGLKPCGCCAASVYDEGDADTADSVADMIRKGLRVERVTFNNPHLPYGCMCPESVAAFAEHNRDVSFSYHTKRRKEIELALNDIADKIAILRDHQRRLECEDFELLIELVRLERLPEDTA